MDLLELPLVFEEAWEHALILTFGVDIPFFERTIWRQFKSSCRNKIIIADGNQFLESCKYYAQSEILRGLNQNYVVDGIIRCTSHPKMILLSNKDSGKLLVGSGNLSHQGYASGGEMFTQYEYKAGFPDHLPAFQSAKNFLELLIDGNYLNPRPIQQIQRLFENTPWLYSSINSSWNPIRHNLHTHFLEQIFSELRNDPVEEIWLLSPFYDKKIRALRRMLDLLEPNNVHILIQPEQTSIDPELLGELRQSYKFNFFVHPIQIKETKAYIHTKLYIFKLKDKSICVQGSPNLSQAAMMLSPPIGNIELANFLFGERNDFNQLLDNLDIDPPIEDVSTLRVTYHESDIGAEEESYLFRLLYGEFNNNRLDLYFSGELPKYDNLFLQIDKYVVDIQPEVRNVNILQFKIPNELSQVFGMIAPVSILFDKNLTSNPIYICDIKSLNNTLEIEEPVDFDPGDIGDLDLEDEEFERLLYELDETLVIDRRSIWKLVGRSIPIDLLDDDDEALELSYEDIDYEQIRQHPKIKKYQIEIREPGYQTKYKKTRLQIILSSIIAHFKGLANLSADREVIDVVLTELDDDLMEKTQEEIEEDQIGKEEAKKHRRISSQGRIRRIMKNFINRYLRGIRSPDFVSLVDMEVMTKNYIIFSHILWRLFVNGEEWVDGKFIIESFVIMWKFYWGVDGKISYFETLNNKQKVETINILREHSSIGLLISALFYSDYLTQREGWIELRFQIRDVWRYILKLSFIEISKDDLEQAWFYFRSLESYEPPTPSMIIDRLSSMAEYETKESFLRSIEEIYDLREGSCLFIKQNVYREFTKKTISTNCLEIRSDIAVLGINDYIEIIHRWLRYYSTNYLRITSNNGNQIFLYDWEAKYGCYYHDRNKPDECEEIRNIPYPKKLEWQESLDRLEFHAHELDQSISLQHILVDNTSEG